MKFGLRDFRPSGLSSRLMLLMALAITPIAIMTVLNGQRAREHAILAAEEDLRRLAGMAAANEAQSLESARQILVDLARVPDLLGAAPRCNALLADVLDRNEGYVNFGLIRLDGEVICSAVPMLEPVNLRDRSHFRRAIDERRFIASDYVFGRLIRKHTINLTYPVADRGGKVVAVVFAGMDLAGFDTFINDISLPPGSVLATADAHGSIISRRPDPQRWFGTRLSRATLDAMAHAGQRALVIDDDGVERLHTFAHVGRPGLSDYTVTIGIPTAIITARARHDQLVSLLGLGASMMLALLAAWLAGDILIARRVRTLRATAGSIAAGKLEARTGIDYGRDEIGKLAAAVDEMVATLQHKEAARSLAERELRAADQRKDEFLERLAHELGRALAPIGTGAHLLKLLHSENAQITHTCSIIARQVEHITSLLDDLLDVSRVTRGRCAQPVAPAPAQAATGARPDAVAPLRVLLVDATVDAVHRLQLFLLAAGHQVEIAYCAADAIELAKVFQPDACLLDVNLPDLDGNELARRLRRLPQATGATLIAMTGSQHDCDARNAAGFAHCLVKPVNTVQLSDVLAGVAAVLAR